MKTSCRNIRADLGAATKCSIECRYESFEMVSNRPICDTIQMSAMGRKRSDTTDEFFGKFIMKTQTLPSGLTFKSQFFNSRVQRGGFHVQEFGRASCSRDLPITMS